ncbi:MAG TPA: cyclic pyranopterin monophosphate synthase MoaC [Sphingomicrobium sp.]|nr:cyclic pyranopterin monophosphate synthase MoaC [Sphingomicrobium sp.]
MAGTHFDAEGRVQMVDVSAKPETARAATARGRVRMEAETLAKVTDRGAAKGDVIAVAELAGIMAAKQTGTLIPLCHPIGLDSVTVRIASDIALPGLTVTAEARTTGRTGVEMEAMTAVSVACLTIYDMLKAVDRGMTIEAVELLAKSGGKSGDWTR